MLRAHYSASLLPFLCYAALYGGKNILTRLKGPFQKRAPWLLGALIILNVVFLPRYFHPIPAAKRAAAQKMFRLIPAEESVITQNHLAPHLCLRPGISLFPDRSPAEWVLLDVDRFGWAAPEETVNETLDFINRNRSRLVYSSEGFFLFNRRAGQSSDRHSREGGNPAVSRSS
jgi:hypothetical protein